MRHLWRFLFLLWTMVAVFGFVTASRVDPWLPGFLPAESYQFWMVAWAVVYLIVKAIETRRVS